MFYRVEGACSTARSDHQSLVRTFVLVQQASMNIDQNSAVYSSCTAFSHPMWGGGMKRLYPFEDYRYSPHPWVTVAGRRQYAFLVYFHNNIQVLITFGDYTGGRRGGSSCSRRLQTSRQHTSRGWSEPRCTTVTGFDGATPFSGHVTTWVQDARRAPLLPCRV